MHQIDYKVFYGNAKREEIEADRNQFARWESDSGSGLYKRIRFYEDLGLSSEGEAYEWIENHDSHDYDQIAVRYTEPEEFTPSKELQKLQERRHKAFQQWYEFQKSFYFENAKSSSVTCKNCNSRISIGKELKYWHSNYCPVCHHDLRPASAVEKEKKLKEKRDELEKEISERETAEKKKAKAKKSFWLVKTEIHV